MENAKKASEEKVRAAWSGTGAFGNFLSETMDNFAYRYISTTGQLAPKTLALDPRTLHVRSQEENMAQALKISAPAAQSGIRELARTVPKAQRPTVAYALSCRIVQGDADRGELVVTATVDWDFPEHPLEGPRQISRSRSFAWDDLQVLRKGFPLALQDVCEIFL